MPLQLLFLATGSRYARTFPHWYHRQVCRIAGIRLNIDGRVADEQGVLLISNHVSWLDITVLSAVAPVSFVAKQEVASWPFVSWLAKLQRSVFVDRNRRSEVGDKANEILEPARSRRPRRAVRRRHLERRQQRGAVQDRACSRRQSPPAARRWAPRSRRRRSRSPIPKSMGCRCAGAGATWSPGMATWIWPATHGGCSGSARSTPISASGRRCRSTQFPDRKALARYAEDKVRNDVVELLRGGRAARR